MLCVKGVTKSVRQKTFWALQASVWSKNKGGGGGGGGGGGFPGSSNAGKLQH